MPDFEDPQRRAPSRERALLAAPTYVPRTPAFLRPEAAAALTPAQQAEQARQERQHAKRLQHQQHQAAQQQARQAKQNATLQRRQLERQANETQQAQVADKRARERQQQQRRAPAPHPAAVARRLLPLVKAQHLDVVRSYLRPLAPHTTREVLLLLAKRHPMQVDKLVGVLPPDQYEDLFRATSQAKQSLGLLNVSSSPLSAPSKPTASRKTPSPTTDVNAVVSRLSELAKLGSGGHAALQAELHRVPPAARASVAQALRQRLPGVARQLDATLQAWAPKAAPTAPDPLLDQAVDVLLRLKTSLANSGGHQVDVGQNPFGITGKFDADMAYRSVVSRVDGAALAELYHEQTGFSFRRDFATLQQRFAQEQGRLAAADAWKALDHHQLAFLEVVAMDLAYVDERLSEFGSEQDRPLARARVTLLQHFGLRAMTVVKGTSGFEMRAFLPIAQGEAHHRAGARPVVAFRGSEGSKIPNLRDASGRLDFDDDLRSLEVGKRQFQENRALIQHWMQFAHAHGLPDVTGHSLGGALAQLTACAWPHLCGHVTTFQAPGIDAATLGDLKTFNAKHQHDGRAIASHHVRFDHDIVEQAGYALTPGFAHRFATPASPVLAALGGAMSPFAAALGWQVGATVGALQALRGRMNVLEATKLPFKGLATGADMAYRLPRTGEHTMPGVRNELIGRDAEAAKLFGTTKGVGAQVKYLASEPVNDFGERPYENLRQDVGGALATLLLKLPTQIIEASGGAVDTSNPRYVAAHQRLSEIARQGKERTATLGQMRTLLQQSDLPEHYAKYLGTQEALEQLWRNWHPTVEL